MYSEHLDLATLQTLLRTEELGRTVSANEVWQEIDSTNARALALAQEGAPHGTIVAARSQTAGRGRQGRQWVSPLDSGLYISFILRPTIALPHIPLISLCSGAAVAVAIHRCCGISIGLKWVNDIVFAGKKLGGILAEMPDRNSVIVGIGINLRTDPNLLASPELRDKVISIEDITGSPINANQLAADLALELERCYGNLIAGHRTRIIDEWVEHNVTIGKVVQARQTNETIEGTAIGIGLDGSLVVRTASGERSLHAGEVSIRLADGSYC